MTLFDLILAVAILLVAVWVRNRGKKLNELGGDVSRLGDSIRSVRNILDNSVKKIGAEVEEVHADLDDFNDRLTPLEEAAHQHGRDDDDDDDD